MGELTEAAKQTVYSFGAEIAELNTPEHCIGCHTPFNIGQELGRLVMSGEVSLEEAHLEFRRRMAACRLGRRIRWEFEGEWVNKTECTLGGTYGDHLTPAEPSTKHFWQKT